MKLLKEVVKKDERTYTNYILVIPVNEKTYRVAVQPKTFGKEWSHPMVRQSFILFDLVSEVIIKDNNENDKGGE